MRMLLALALLLLPVVADAQARVISALDVGQADGELLPTLILNVLDGPPRTVTVRDHATGKLLGTSRGFVACTEENECPKPGVLYGPDEHPANPGGLFQPPDPRYWGVWGHLKSAVVDGQKLRVAINGRKAIVLTCVGETTSWGVSHVHCARRP